MCFLKKLPEDIHEHEHLKTTGTEKPRTIFQGPMGYQTVDSTGKACDIASEMEPKTQGGRLQYS